MLPETILAAIISYFVMLAAMFLHRVRSVHIGIMVLIMIFDLMMPFYLYMNRDWKERLIDHGEILSFLVMMHIGLLIALYWLYAMQIKAGRQLMKTGEERERHKTQAKGLLLIRFLVILTGAILYEPDNVIE